MPRLFRFSGRKSTGCSEEKNIKFDGDLEGELTDIWMDPICLKVGRNFPLCSAVAVRWFVSFCWLRRGTRGSSLHWLDSSPILPPTVAMSCVNPWPQQLPLIWWVGRGPPDKNSETLDKQTTRISGAAMRSWWSAIQVNEAALSLHASLLSGWTPPPPQSPPFSRRERQMVRRGQPHFVH